MSPPVVGLDALVARLRQCGGFPVFLGHVAHHRQVAVQLLYIVGHLRGVAVRSRTVAVQSHEVDDVVARIAFQVARLVAVGLGAGRVGIEGIGDATLLQPAGGQLPQRLVLLSGTVLLPPPEPGASVFVPRAEEHRDAYAVGRLKRIEEVGHAVEPAEEQLVLLAAVQHGSHRPRLDILQRVGHPCRATAERVVHVPAEGHHAAAVVVGNNLLADAVERYAVEVTLAAQLQPSEVEAQHCGVVVAHALHVAACVYGGVVAVVGLPPYAIDGGIVLTEHVNRRVAQRLQPLQQVLRALRASAVGQRVVGLLRVVATASKQHDQQQAIRNSYNTQVLHLKINNSHNILSSYTLGCKGNKKN